MERRTQSSAHPEVDQQNYNHHNKNNINSNNNNSLIVNMNDDNGSSNVINFNHNISSGSSASGSSSSCGSTASHNLYTTTATIELKQTPHQQSEQLGDSTDKINSYSNTNTNSSRSTTENLTASHNRIITIQSRQQPVTLRKKILQRQKPTEIHEDMDDVDYAADVEEEDEDDDDDDDYDDDGDGHHYFHEQNELHNNDVDDDDNGDDILKHEHKYKFTHHHHHQHHRQLPTPIIFQKHLQFQAQKAQSESALLLLNNITTATTTTTITTTTTNTMTTTTTTTTTKGINSNAKMHTTKESFHTITTTIPTSGLPASAPIDITNISKADTVAAAAAATTNHTLLRTQLLQHTNSFDSQCDSSLSPSSLRRHTNGMLQRDNSLHSDSSHYSSVDSLLEARKPDPEAILINLGFGPINSEDILSRIPKRFLKPSQVRGIDTEAFVKRLQLANSLADHSVLGYRGLIGNPDVPPSSIVAKIMQRFEVNERKKSMGSVEHTIR